MRFFTQLITATILVSLASFYVPRIHYSILRNYVEKHVVMITTADGKHGGTGAHVETPSGKIVVLTNAHVCEGVVDKNNNVWLKNADSFEQHKVLEISDKTDLCVVEPILDTGLKIAKEESFKSIVYVVGHPELMPTTLSPGELIGQAFVDVFDHVIETDADKCDLPKQRAVVALDQFGFPVNLCVLHIKSNLSNVIILPGNSGSPLVNYRGQLIGVAYAGSIRSNWGIFVVLDDVKAFLKNR